MSLHFHDKIVSKHVERASYIFIAGLFAFFFVLLVMSAIVKHVEHEEQLRLARCVAVERGDNLYWYCKDIDYERSNTGAYGGNARRSPPPKNAGTPI